jgi:flagellar motor switch protein FliM
MPPTLSKNEVDALMDALNEGHVDAPSDDDQAQQLDEDVKTLDLTSRDRIVRGRMPTLDVIHGRLAQRFGTRLCALLRRDAELLPEVAQPQKLGEFLSYQPTPACIHLIGLSPLQGTGLVCLQPELFFFLLDAVFGGRGLTAGPGTGRTGGRELTSIELAFAADLIGGFAQDMSSAWVEVRALKPNYLSTVVVPEHVAIGTPSDVVMASTFRLRTGSHEFRMDIVLPYSALEPIKSRLVEQHMEETPADRQRWLERLQTSLERVPLRLQLELGRTRISLVELMRLSPGDVIRLDRAPSSRLPLRAGDRVVSWVAPLRIDGNLGFEFQEWRSDEP